MQRNLCLLENENVTFLSDIHHVILEVKSRTTHEVPPKLTALLISLCVHMCGNSCVHATYEGAHTHCTSQIKTRGEGGKGCKTHTTQKDARHPPGKSSRRARVSPQTPGLPISPFVACQLGSRGEPGRRWVRVRSANTLRVHSTFLSTHTGWLTTAVFQGSNGLSGVHGHCIYLVTLREHAINLATLERSEEFRGCRLSCFTRLAALWPSAGRHSWPTHTPDLSLSRFLPCTTTGLGEVTGVLVSHISRGLTFHLDFLYSCP